MWGVINSEYSVTPPNHPVMQSSNHHLRVRDRGGMGRKEHTSEARSAAG